MIRVIGGERSDETIEPLISLIRMLALSVGTGELVRWELRRLFREFTLMNANFFLLRFNSQVRHIG